MRVVICGGRNYQATPDDVRLLDKLREELPITVVMSGCSGRADIFGESWAVARNIPVRLYPVDAGQWKEEGKLAGPLRNARMAEVADAVIAFPGGRGTASMVRVARATGVRVIEVLPEEVDILTQTDESD